MRFCRFFLVAFLITSLLFGVLVGGEYENAFLLRGLPMSNSSQGEAWLKSRLISYGSWEDYQKKGNLPGFKTDSFGFVSGLQRRGKLDVFLGFDVGADWISSSEKGSGLDKDSDLFKMFLHGGMERDQWLWDFRIGYAYHDQKIMQTTHSTLFRGKNRADQYGFSTEFRIKVSSGLFQMEPFIGFDYFCLDENDSQLHSQFGPIQVRDVLKKNSRTKGGRIGLRYKWRHTGLFATWYPELNAFWYHEFEDRDLFRSAWGDPFPGVYTLSGYQNDQDHLVFGASVLGNYGKSMDLFFKYSTSVTGKENIHTAMAGMNWYFR